MSRFVMTLGEADKAWLVQAANAEKTSLASIIRKAIRAYKVAALKQAPPSLEVLLAKTQHSWNQGDGLAYQTQVREDWEG